MEQGFYYVSDIYVPSLDLFILGEVEFDALYEVTYSYDLRTDIECFFFAVESALLIIDFLYA